MTEKLIAMYEQNPCLYNTKHKFYSNKHARHDALCKIWEELKDLCPQLTVEEVKKKIIKVRSQFTHEQAKINKKKWGSLATALIKWKTSTIVRRSGMNPCCS